MNQEQSTKYNFSLILLVILLTGLIVGSGVYLWQKSYNKKLQAQNQQLQQEINELQDKVNELQNQVTQLQGQQGTQKNGEEPIDKLGTTEKAMGYIKAVYEKDGKRYLDIDYVQYLTGDEAIRAIREDGKCSPDIYPDPSYCIPNGYYIRNQNPKIRTFEISKNVEILMQTYGSGKCHVRQNEKVSYEIFKSFWGSNPTCVHLKDLPYNVEVKNGIVTKITEQFIP